MTVEVEYYNSMADRATKIAARTAWRKLNEAHIDSAGNTVPDTEGRMIWGNGPDLGQYAQLPMIPKGLVYSTGTFTAAEIPNLDTSKITTGTMATARLGSGTADTTTYLRGDQSYAVPAGGSATKNQWDYIRTGGVSWYGTAVNCTASTTTALTANVARAWPFIVRKGFAIDRIQFEVTTLVAGNCVVGIYNSNSSNYPNALLLQGTAASTGTTGLKTTTISSTLVDDTLYWMAYNASAAPTLRAVSQAAVPAILGNDGTVGTNRQITGLTVAQTYNATMPATYTAGATNLLSSIAPLIIVRAT